MTDTRQINLARGLRRNQTEAEKILWQKLRTFRCQGGRFRRQHPVGDYIVDFCCLEASLIIEVDGGQHNETSKVESDKARTSWLNERGYIVMRFWDNDVLTNLESVINTIGERCTLTPVSP